MRSLYLCLLVLFTLGTTSCSSTTSAPSAQAIGPASGGLRFVGTLEISGSAVFVDGVPAHDGILLYDGTTLTTGTASSARVLLEGGGSIQLDQKTDPKFQFQLLREGWCLVTSLFSGQLFGDSQGVCVTIETVDGPGSIKSQVNVQVETGGTVWTVAKGAVRLNVPSGKVVDAGKSVTVSRGRIMASVALSPDELRRITAWRENYFVVPPSSIIPSPSVVPPPPAPPPAPSTPPPYTP